MKNPFDDENANFHVLINEEEQYSLWPIFAKIPSGWEVVLKDQSRNICLDFIEKNWTDMRPKSLRAAIEKSMNKK